jgi:hypothetical protein
MLKSTLFVGAMLLALVSSTVSAGSAVPGYTPPGGTSVAGCCWVLINGKWYCVAC